MSYEEEDTCIDKELQSTEKKQSLTEKIKKKSKIKGLHRAEEQKTLATLETQYKARNSVCSDDACHMRRRIHVI